MYEMEEASRHSTYCFNVFVMMTVFNFINARKLNDELNVFKGMFASAYFPVIVFAIFVLQVILVTFAGFPLGVGKWVSYQFKTFKGIRNYWMVDMHWIWICWSYLEISSEGNS